MTPRPRLRLILQAAGAAVFLLGAWTAAFPAVQGRGKTEAGINVLLVTMDTTRADRLGCYGYAKALTPRLDALASAGVRFDRAYAQAPLTLPSHCSLMTGTVPAYHRVHNNGFYYLDPRRTTLAEILKKDGYATAAFVSSFTVDSRFGLDQGFDVYDDDFQEGEILKSFRSERTADKVYESFARWLDENAGRKFFCWLHFFDPHLPYQPPSDFRHPRSDSPYDAEIAYMDEFIGKSIDALRRNGVLGRTLIVLCGDHGEGLGERKEIDHGLFLYDNTVRVPLIMYWENRLPQGRVVSSRVRLIDLVPTILTLAGLAPPKESQGKNLVPLMKGKKGIDLPVYLESYYPRENYGWSEITGLVDGDWKYLQSPKPELFNLALDPREKRNVLLQEPGIARDMRKKLQESAEKLSSEKDGGKRRLSPEEEERLRSLGYLGRPSDGRSEKALPDPKDKIEDYLLYFRGNLHETRGEYSEAEKCYREFLRLNPDVPGNFVNLGFLYMKMNRVEEAVHVLEEGLRSHPDSVLILSRLMNFYLKAERDEDALAAGRILLAVDPRYFDALFLSGSIQAKKGEWKAALGFYRRALDIEPENKALRMRIGLSLAALGEYENALAVYEILWNQYPEDEAVCLELSRVYESLGRIGPARGALKRLLDVRPSAELGYAYAFLSEKAGDLKEAVFWLKNYLETTAEKRTKRKSEAEAVLRRWEERLKSGSGPREFPSPRRGKRPRAAQRPSGPEDRAEP
ncbi:MAG: sulfatase-like hydrolase/transferase [Acidobacteriota bacterium]|nr:sulfatase-like hydrolase/transferase [Acidobacteriota bacterium]OQB58836.1 MAG: Choline-sulfatase [Candidatus Aminicenantes bacterium ADurb.Bin147]HNQ79996.1 sulfatase-like hydrolase/transferase [Candidatus Aminicenantes bacterium]MDD8028849.1 sulfatase-like hydrolase/transferase [Acidobacteriota bacterium]MDD8033373.1 sulfatase-like hydrolase/transferase [Acidobacteriota bacterium]